MVKHLGRLKDILEGSGAAGKKMLTPFGVLAPPLGTARLKAVEVVSALLLTCNPVAEAGTAHLSTSSQVKEHCQHRT